MALTIAGYDPTGGAGVGSDLRTFYDLGVQGVSVVTSLTAQNTRVVRMIRAVPPAFLTRQASVLLEEFTPDAVKVGMTGSAANVRAVARIIKTRALKNVVLDPVMASTGGYRLLEKKGVEALRGLLPLVRVVTPNLTEAAALSGITVEDPASMQDAAFAIHELGARAVLVKGGHLKTDPVDILYDGKEFHHYRARRIKGRSARFHGTGCILSAAIAAGLAKGKTLEDSVIEARAYLRRIITKRRA